jgi:hypothetical protein
MPKYSIKKLKGARVLFMKHQMNKRKDTFLTLR